MPRSSIFDSDNIRSGFSYTAPSITLSASNAEINGGLSFDLPLAVVQSMQQQAYKYTNANTQNAYGFLGGVVGGAQSQINATTQTAQNSLNAQAYTVIEYGDNLITKAFKNIFDISDRSARAQEYVAKRAYGGGGCFITTAICEAENKPDNCDELETLRNWRDNVLAKMDGGKSLIDHYYHIAPFIVDQINIRDDAKEIWSLLRTVYLYPAIKAINEGRHCDALYLYTLMTATAQSIAKGY